MQFTKVYIIHELQNKIPRFWMSDNLDPEIRSFLLVWFDSKPKASRQRMHLQHCPRDFNTSLLGCDDVCHSEADMIFQESFFRVETSMTANWIEAVLILNFESSTFLKNKLLKTFESLPLRRRWLPFLQGAKMAWRKLVKELPATMDTSGISRITPQRSMDSSRKRRVAVPSLSRKKNAVDGHPSSCTTWDSSTLIDYRIFMWSIDIVSDQPTNTLNKPKGLKPHITESRLSHGEVCLQNA